MLVEKLELTCPQCNSQTYIKFSSTRSLTFNCGCEWKAVLMEGKRSWEYENKSGASVKNATVAKRAGSSPTVHINDTIRLKGVTPKGIELINRFGEWWKVNSGVPKSQIREESWGVVSLPKAKTEAARRAVYQTFIQKEHDPDFLVTAVCPFPQVFNKKDYK